MIITELLKSFLPVLKPLLDVLEIALLLTALGVTTATSIEGTIRTYRSQSFLLAFVTGLTALIKVIEGETGSLGTGMLILFIMLLPLALASSIKWLLARATVRASVGQGRHVSLGKEAREREAEKEWLTFGAGVRQRGRDLLIFVFLIAVAFLIAFRVFPGTPSQAEPIGVMVSLALHLVGLYNMVMKRDTISQVIGLLVMDHGLYLAVVKIVAVPVPATIFVISLYFYTLITVTILVFLLPQVRRWTGSIDLSEIADSSSLEG